MHELCKSSRIYRDSLRDNVVMLACENTRPSNSFDEGFNNIYEPYIMYLKYSLVFYVSQTIYFTFPKTKQKIQTWHFANQI